MNVTHLTPSIQRIEFDDIWRTTIVEFDDRHLYVRRRNGPMELGTSTRLLHHLSPAITDDYSNDPDSARKVHMSWLFLLGAIVVFFSDHNAGIPLLAPALLLVWLVLFGFNINATLPKRSLAVNDDFGALVVRILEAPAGDDAGATRRKAFAIALGKAIEDAKRNEYGLAGRG